LPFVVQSVAALGLLLAALFRKPLVMQVVSASLVCGSSFLPASGKYVGSDPDPTIRSSLARDHGY